MSNDIKPLNVNDVDTQKKLYNLQQANAIPKEIIKIFNDLILKDFSHNQATVRQEAVIKRIIEVLGGKREDIFEKHWLDIEPLFEEAGWTVTYDNPGYCEDYEASWLFEKE
jgi:hypothetical protein